ncbi:MAG: ABC transporter permease [Saprospiraceae bacterium]
MLQPPKRTIHFLRWFCDDRFHEEIEGDLYEMYEELVETFGEKKANKKFTRVTLSYLRPYFFQKRAYSLNSFAMHKFHFKLAFRYFQRNKTFAIINIFGLALGIASAVLIGILVQNETSFDRFHSAFDRLYRVVRVTQIEGADEFRTGVVFPFVAALRERLPGAAEATATYSVFDQYLAVLNEEGGIKKKFKEAKGGAIVDNGFFQVLDFGRKGKPWIAGNPATALESKFSMVLTASFAKKYFSDEDPMGRIIRLNNTYNFTVTGVIEDLPANTDFPFTYLLSFASLEDVFGDFVHTNWNGVSDQSQCYVRLKEGMEPATFHEQLDKMHASFVSEQLAADRKYRLQPLSELHTDSRFGNYSGRTMSGRVVLILLAIGFFILLTACINYINLATAQSTIRAKEMGMRKVVGSKRSAIMLQALLETFLISFLAMGLGVGVLKLAMPLLENFMGIRFYDYWNYKLLGSLLGLCFFITLAAGFYPGKVLSRFKPTQAFRQSLNQPTLGNVSLRRVLIICQFVVAQVFIIGTIAVILQVNHFKKLDWGFNKEAVVTIQVPDADTRPEVRQSLYNEWHNTPNIGTISFAASAPSVADQGRNFTEISRRESIGVDPIGCEVLTIDTAFIGLYNIQLIAGRDLLPGEADIKKAVVISETLARDLGFDQPEEAINQAINFNGHRCFIAGVAKDFQVGSLHDGEEGGRVAMWHNPEGFGMASIKLKTGAFDKLSQTLKAIENIWTATFPEHVFEYQFLDDRLAAHYAIETKMSQLFKFLAGMAICISCLGLYGLVTFILHQKTKEIGVRKVLGASVGNILGLVMREYIRLLLVAFTIAAPFTFWALTQWLDNFTYRIDLSIWVFVGGLLISLVVAVFTVGYKSFKVASLNPSAALKME